jgi:hypothetical protein
MTSLNKVETGTVDVGENKIIVDDPDSRKLRSNIGNIKWTWLIMYTLPVVMYTIYAWINPDGVGFGKDYSPCYVVTE